jgi:hypothetical protein
MTDWRTYWAACRVSHLQIGLIHLSVHVSHNLSHTITYVLSATLNKFTLKILASISEMESRLWKCIYRHCIELATYICGVTELHIYISYLSCSRNTSLRESNKMASVFIRKPFNHRYSSKRKIFVARLWPRRCCLIIPSCISRARL